MFARGQRECREGPRDKVQEGGQNGRKRWSAVGRPGQGAALPTAAPPSPGLRGCIARAASCPGRRPAAVTHTPVEESLFHIIGCYHQYAAREGDVETLSLEELKALLADNVPHFMESLGRKEPCYLSELFRAADKNKDKQICFDEFLFVLGRLLKDYHLLYHRRQCACYCTRHSLH